MGLLTCDFIDLLVTLPDINISLKSPRDHALLEEANANYSLLAFLLHIPNFHIKSFIIDFIKIDMLNTAGN